MTLQEIMKKAHHIAKRQLIGDYQAKLALALRMVWREVKKQKTMEELPALTGTPKQVAWAKDIRKRMAERLLEIIEHRKRVGVPYDYQQNLFARLMEVTNSKFWIETMVFHNHWNYTEKRLLPQIEEALEKEKATRP